MDSHTALVSGFAHSFISGKPIANGKVIALEDDQLVLFTDSQGRFGPFSWPVGKAITLVFEKAGSFWSGYKTIQTPTLVVPPEGFNSENFYKNISFQVPSNFAYKILSLAMGVKASDYACQIAATITPPHITMKDIPQGVEGVTVSLCPPVKCKIFYFDIFPFFHKTNPINRKLTATSEDGGIVCVNVPPGDYILEAKKGDAVFSKVTIKARAGIIVNASPPHGPVMLQESKQKPTEKPYNYFKFFKTTCAVTLGISGTAAVSLPVGITAAVLSYVLPEISEKISSNCLRKSKQ